MHEMQHQQNGFVLKQISINGCSFDLQWPDKSACRSGHFLGYLEHFPFPLSAIFSSLTMESIWMR